MEIFQAVGIGETTLLGYLSDARPQEYGNCFGVHLEGNAGAMKIVNFNLENLDALVKEHGLTWPIKVAQLGIASYGYRIGVIHDERIDNRWYQTRFCEVCCPDELLPITQKLQHARDEALGARRSCGNGGVVYDFTKRAPCGALPECIPAPGGRVGFYAYESPGSVVFSSHPDILKLDFK